MESKMKRVVLAAAAASILLITGIICQAQDAAVLTIDGKISGTAPRDFSLNQLESLGLETIETTTPWHDGKVIFEGVSLRRFMEHVGASGNTADVFALNNYYTKIPLSDFIQYQVILATRKNGAHMPVADKGPLFIIYPFDSLRELKSELFYSRSAWQIRKITIE
jgi:hypothetical protein